MRHQPEHAARLVVDAGDIVARAVGIGVARSPRRSRRNSGTRRGLRLRAARASHRRRNSSHPCARWESARPRRFCSDGIGRVVPLDAKMHVLADEFQRRIAHQHAGQQPGLGQHLEAVADAEHRRPGACPRRHLAHHRRMRRHGAGAEIVAVGEAARQHDQIACRDRRCRRARPWPAGAPSRLRAPPPRRGRNSIRERR